MKRGMNIQVSSKKMSTEEFCRRIGKKLTLLNKIGPDYDSADKII